jgi:serine protease
VIYNIVCRAVLALTVTIVFTTATMSSVFAGTAGPPKNIEASAPEEMMVSSLIVKPHVEAGAQLSSALQAFDARGLSKSARVPLTVVRPMSGKAHVVKLEHPVTLSEARAVAARLMHNDPSIEYAEPDRIVHALLTPTDPAYAPSQWNYFAPAGANKGGANLPLAWDVTRGSSTVVVAVIDNGYRQHIDFAPVLPGYDFITDPTRSNDGNGRDADAQDPSDAVVAGECGQATPAVTNHWHGTSMIGFIAALMNNGQYGTGVAPLVKILPARVIGKCGGLTSDVVDGMRWAAGLSVPGVPPNPSPANVLNISIGHPGSCDTFGAFQAAVTDIVNAGKVIVVAAGNDQFNPGLEAPANCSGVIAVTAHAIDGDLAQYANVSAQVAISAPGGGCGKLAFQSTCFSESDSNGLGLYFYSNTGVTSPGADSFGVGEGSSGSAAQVSGVAALLLSVKPTLTPGQIRSILQSSARPFPAGSWCTTAAATGLCGAGLLDANAALRITAIPPVVTITNPAQVVAPNVTVVLSGTATADVGRSINSYSWTQLTGASVGTIASSNTANASFTAPATGIYSFRLTATDTVGLTGTATATVRVNSPPVLTPVAAQTVVRGQALSFTVSATDVDGDFPIFVSVSLPPGATLSSTGTFSWPNATPVGSYILTYFARDNDVNSTLGTVNITVVNPSPSFVNPPSSSGGGCTIARTGSGDSMFATLFLVSLALFAWRVMRRRR